MENSREKLLYLLFPFALLISTVYYYSYWGTFKINVFLFLEIQDIIMGAAYPLIGSACLVILYVLLNSAALHTPSFTKFARITLFMSKRPRFKLARSIFLLAFLSIISVLLVVDFRTTDLSYVSAYLVLFIVLSICASALLIIYGIGEEVIKSRFLRFMLSAGMFLMLSLSFWSGNVSGAKVIDGHSYDFTTLPLEGSASNEGQKVKFLGQAGDYFFFLSMDNQKKYIVNRDQVKTLILEEYNKKTDPKFNQAIKKP